MVGWLGGDQLHLSYVGTFDDAPGRIVSGVGVPYAFCFFFPLRRDDILKPLDATRCGDGVREAFL